MAQLLSKADMQKRMERMVGGKAVDMGNPGQFVIRVNMEQSA